MKQFKKILAMGLCLFVGLGTLSGCGAGGVSSTDEVSSTNEVSSTDGAGSADEVSSTDGDNSESGDSSESASNVVAGLVCLHDENAPYDQNFISAFRESCEKQGLVEGETYFISTNVPEGQECYEEVMNMVDRGCNLVFADSFGHEDYMIQAAAECPKVQFCHATGTKAHTQNLSNYHNAFASIYMGRYLAGVTAGMKLNEMIEAGEFTADEAKMGYVGAFTYAEVISGYTSFYLGAKSVCPSVTMDVTFTGSWYDETKEKEGAQALIEGGCKLISQHADSMGAPTACEKAGIPNVSYNGSMLSACPNTYLVSSRINWSPYYNYAMDAVKEGKAIDTDWTGTMDTDSVLLTELNASVAAEGTEQKLEEVKKALQDGSVQVFDTSTFTVDGKTLDSYLADVDTDADNTGDTEVIRDGVFQESTFRSAPYFNLQIDGIKLLDTAF